MPEARWPEEELKSHRIGGLTTKARRELGASHACSEAEFPASLGGPPTRNVFRDDEARAEGKCKTVYLQLEKEGVLVYHFLGTTHTKGNI